MPESDRERRGGKLRLQRDRDPLIPRLDRANPDTSAS
jgi:hypothetical protein